jgi:hypothetical protein
MSEIPPPPLVNAKPQQPTNGPLKPLRAGHGSPAGPSTEIRNAPPSPGPPGTGASSEGKEMAEAVRRLRDFTSSKGWYELQRRLLDAGETDYREYAKIEPKMVAVPGQAQLFDFEGRQLRLKGSRKDPLLLKDASTGQVEEAPHSTALKSSFQPCQSSLCTRSRALLSSLIWPPGAVGQEQTYQAFQPLGARSL